MTGNLFFAWVLALFFVVAISIGVLGVGLRVKNLVLGLGLFLQAVLLIGMLPYGFSLLPMLLFLGVGWFWFFKHNSLNGCCESVIPTYTKTAGVHALSHWAFLIFPALYFLVRFVAASVPQQHSDPLYYHLAAPKLWAQLSQIRITPEHPSFAQSTLWECLYGLPMIFMRAASGFQSQLEFVSAQITGQWLHFFWGQIGAWILLVVLFLKYLPKNYFAPACFLAWLIGQLPCVEWTGCLAKNDYIVALFFLAALLSEKAWIAGFLFGCAMATKNLAAFGLLLVPLFAFKKSPRSLAIFAGSAALGLAPVLVRNLVFTGNPLFPAFDAQFGPGWVSDLWRDHIVSFGGKFSLDFWPWLSGKLFEKALPKVLLAIAVVCAVFNKRSQVVLAVGAVALFPLACFFRSFADGRYGAFILSPVLVLAIAPVISRIKVIHLLPTLALGLLINIPVDILYKIPARYAFAPATKYLEEFHPFYTFKKWTAENLPQNAVIISTADKTGYYFRQRFETMSEMRNWEESALTSPTFAVFLQTASNDLHADSPPRYFFVETINHYPPFFRHFWESVERTRRLAVFQNDQGYILESQAVQIAQHRRTKQ